MERIGYLRKTFIYEYKYWPQTSDCMNCNQVKILKKSMVFFRQPLDILVFLDILYPVFQKRMKKTPLWCVVS